MGRFQLRVLAASAAALLAVAAGCGGGGGEEEDDSDFDHDATGIWMGTDTPDGRAGTTMTVVVAPNGRFVAVGGYRYLSGTGTVSGDRLTANATGWAPTGTTFANGSTSGSFSLTGTAFEGNRIDVSYSGASESGRIVVNYEASRSNRSASRAKVAGSYATSTGSASLAINSNGAITFNSTQGTNCIGNGTITAPDATRNVYTWTLTLSGCTAVNGNADGVAYLDDAAPGSDNRIVMIGATSSATFGVIATK